MSRPPSRTLLVFGRSPLPGKVKTRMIPEIGAAAAARLYRRMLFDALETATAMRDVHCELWLDTPPVDPALTALARDRGIAVKTQRGDDLGQRMHHALDEALTTADHAVLIGSDCPGIDRGYLQTAFQALQHHPAVLGPARDGGYVLIGLDHPMPSLFSGVHWSTGQVLSETRKRLHSLGSPWHELSPLQDVDRVSDLKAYPQLAPLVDPMTGHRS